MTRYLELDRARRRATVLRHLKHRVEARLRRAAARAAAGDDCPDLEHVAQRYEMVLDAFASARRTADHLVMKHIGTLPAP